MKLAPVIVELFGTCSLHVPPGMVRAVVLAGKRRDIIRAKGVTMFANRVWFAAVTVFTAGIGCAASAGTVEVRSDAETRAYLSGNGFLGRGMYEPAIEEYRAFLADHADHEKAPVARYGSAVCLLRLSRFDEALEALEPLADKADFEYAAEASVMRGQCRLARKEYGLAATAFKEVVRKHRKHDLADDAAAGWAEALYDDGKYADAAERCERFVESWPDSPLRARVEYFWGLAEVGRSGDAAAVAHWAKVLELDPQGPYAGQATLLSAQGKQRLGDLPESERLYRMVLERGGEETADALLGLASVVGQHGASEEAGRFMDRLVREFPDRASRPAVQLQRGRAAFEQGKFDQASELFHLAAEEPALADQAAYWSAKCSLRSGRFSEAADRLERAIRENATSPILADMQYDRAVALLQAHQSDPAIRALEEYLDRFGDHVMAADASHLLAMTEHQAGKYSSSLAHCKTFVKRYENHPLSTAIELLIAENDFLSGQFEAAVADYRRFLDRHAESADAPKARFRLGMGLFRLGKFDEAEPLLTQSMNELGANPRYRGVLQALGEISFQRGEWKSAERYFGEFIEGDEATGSDDVWLKLGLARIRQEQFEPSLSVFEAVIERFPDSPHRLQAVFERGQALLALKRSAEAADAFRNVLGNGEESRFASFARRHLSAIAMENKDFEAAAKFLGPSNSDDASGADVLFQRSQALMGAGKFAEAEESLNEFLRRFPSHESAVFARAQLAIALSRQDRCLDALITIEALDHEGMERLDGGLRSSAQYEKAWCLRKTGQNDASAAAYRALLNDEVGGAERTEQRASRMRIRLHAMLDLAALESESGRLDAAKKLLVDLVEAADGAEVEREVKEQAYYRLGVCEYETGEFGKASDRFEYLLTQFEGSDLTASAEFFCGECHFKANRSDRAIKHFARLVDNFESDAAYPTALLRLGECYATTQQWSASEQSFAKYLEGFGDREQWFQARFGLGWARENQRRYDDAIADYRQVVDRHRGPTAARAQFQIGECLFAKDDYKSAVRELLKVDIHYGYAEWSAAALYEAGRCLEKSAEPVAARKQFREVTERFGDTKWAALARERFETVSAGGLPGQ